MKFEPFLPGIKIVPAKIEFEPVHTEETGNSWRSEAERFYLHAPGAGSFCARDRDTIEYDLFPGADNEWVKLYLDSQLTVALLHQRGIMSFHAGSFSYKGDGIIVSGESGAGKSSVVLSFSLGGHDFLSDDVTPVEFIEEKPYIIPFHPKARLRENTIDQFRIERARLTDGEAGSGKSYLEMPAFDGRVPLKIVISIVQDDCREPSFYEPGPAEKFTILRSEICMWEILEGMPEREPQYFGQLMNIISQVRIIRAVRPANIRIEDFRKAIETYIF